MVVIVGVAVVFTVVVVLVVSVHALGVCPMRPKPLIAVLAGVVVEVVTRLDSFNVVRPFSEDRLK